MRNLFFGVLTILTATSAAQAANVQYFDFSAWSATVSPYTGVNFEGIVAAPDVVSYPGGSTSVGNVVFSVGPSAPASLLFVIGGPNATYYPQSAISSQNTSSDPLEFEDLLITVPNVNALAFHFGHLFDADVVATVTLSDGSVYSVTSSAAPSLSFFGIIAPDGISWVDITVPADRFAISITDFSYAAPEPASMPLIGAVMTTLAWLIRRRNSVTSMRSVRSGGRLLAPIMLGTSHYRIP